MMMTNESIDADRKAFSTAFNSDIEDVPNVAPVRDIGDRLASGEGTKVAGSGISAHSELGLKTEGLHESQDKAPIVQSPVGAGGSGKKALKKRDEERKVAGEKAKDINVDETNDFELQQKEHRAAQERLPNGFR